MFVNYVFCYKIFHFRGHFRLDVQLMVLGSYSACKLVFAKNQDAHNTTQIEKCYSKILTLLKVYEKSIIFNLFTVSLKIRNLFEYYYFENKIYVKWMFI